MSTIDKIHEAVRRFYQERKGCASPRYLVMSIEARQRLETEIRMSAWIPVDREKDPEPDRFQGMTIAIVEYAKPDFMEVL